MTSGLIQVKVLEILAMTEPKTDRVMISTQPGIGSEQGHCAHGRRANGCDDCKVRLFSVCGALDRSELEELDRISQVRVFPPKATLFEQQALAGSVFNVTEGTVRLCKSLPDGRRQIVGFALAGDFLGLALMDR